MAAAAVVGTGYQISAAKTAKTRATDQRKEADKSQRRLEADLKNRTMNEKATESQRILLARQKNANSGAAVKGGPGTTTPTSTIGGAGLSGRKTLLGL